MSHTVRVKQVQLSDLSILKAVVDRLPDADFVKPNGDIVNSPDEAIGEFHFYSGSANGIGIKLPGWQYPVVVDPQTGHYSFDNFNGRWGDQDKIDQLVQEYSMDKLTAEALAANARMAKQEMLENGDVEITFCKLETGY